MSSEVNVGTQLFEEGAHRLPESASREVLEQCPAMHTALAKLAQMAADYDPRRSSIGLGAFESKEISPTELYEQLRNNFRLTLEPEELGAVVYRFDKNGTGNIDCAEFLVEFWRLRRIEKERRDAVALGELRRTQRREGKLAQVRATRFAAKPLQATEAPITWPRTHLKSALRKLRTAAETWQHRNASVAAFEGPHMLVHREIGEFATCREMSPTSFAQQLRLGFRMRLSQAEVAVLLKRYSIAGHPEKAVDTTRFLNEFLHMGLVGRTRQAALKRAQTADINRRAAEREAETRERHAEAATATNLTGTRPHTVNDLDAALLKIARKAAFYDATRVNSLAAFEGATMTPLLFRDQLRNNMQLEFTPCELGALVDRYDVQGHGEIDCGEFMNEFYRMGRAQRAEHDEGAMALTQRLNQRSQRRHEELTAKYKQAISAKMVLPTDTSSMTGGNTATAGGDSLTLRPFTSSAASHQRCGGGSFLDQMQARLDKIDPKNYARGWDYRASQ